MSAGSLTVWLLRSSGLFKVLKYFLFQPPRPASSRMSSGGRGAPEQRRHHSKEDREEHKHRRKKEKVGAKYLLAP